MLVFLLCLGWNALDLIQRRADLGTGWVVGWDDNFYLAWGRSLAVDGDWRFDNDIAFAASVSPGGAEVLRAHLAERTPAGRVPNKYPCGVGVLAVPFLLVTRVVLDVAASAGLTTRSDPFSSLYVLAFIASNVFWAAVGLATAWTLLRREYSPGVAGPALLVGAIGLPLGYYIWFEPVMAHATGFGIVTLFIACVVGWADRVTVAHDGATGWPGWAVLMGLLLGAAVLVRFTNVVMALVPVVVGLAVRPSRRHDGSWVAVMLTSLGLAAVGTLIGFMPQLVAWKVVYGTFLVDSYVGETLTAWPRHLVSILFGARNGLFSWTPLALIAVTGLVIGVRNRVLCRAGLVVLAATAWIYGGWQMYWLGHSFGMRGFVDASFFLLVGLAEVFMRAQRIPSRAVARAGRIVVALLVVWTLHLIVCYRAQIQPHGEPLAVRPLFTEWRRWTRQIYADTGFRMLVRASHPGARPVDGPRRPGEDRR